MFNTILTISSFIICCVALGLNCFALGRQIRLNKDFIKEIELRSKYEKYLISRYEEVYEEKQKLAAKLYRKGFESEKIRKYLHL